MIFSLNVRDRERGARRRLCLRGFSTLFSGSGLEALDSRRDKPGELYLDVNLDLSMFGVTAAAPGGARSSLCSFISIIWRLEIDNWWWTCRDTRRCETIGLSSKFSGYG